MCIPSQRPERRPVVPRKLWSQKDHPRSESSMRYRAAMFTAAPFTAGGLREHRLPACQQLGEWWNGLVAGHSHVGTSRRSWGQVEGGLMPKTLQVALCNKLWDTKGRAIFCCPRLMGPTHITWDWLREGSILIHKVPKPASQQNSKWEM